MLLPVCWICFSLNQTYNLEWVFSGLKLYFDHLLGLIYKQIKLTLTFKLIWLHHFREQNTGLNQFLRIFSPFLSLFLLWLWLKDGQLLASFSWIFLWIGLFRVPGGWKWFWRPFDFSCSNTISTNAHLYTRNVEILCIFVMKKCRSPFRLPRGWSLFIFNNPQAFL